MLDQWSFLSLPSFSFYWLAAVAGGSLFGVGMTLAGGCSSSSFYRVGEGMVGSFVAILTFIIFAAATSAGVMRPVALALYSYQWTGQSSTTLPGVLGISHWVFIALITLSLGLWLFLSHSPQPARGWGWRRTGITIGLVATLAWYTSGLTGRSWGLSMTGPSASLLLYLTSGDPGALDWGTFQLLGIPVGAFVAASWNGEFRWRSPQAVRVMQQAAGGAMMGTGAVIAGGCNIGNSLTGLGALSLTSLVATIFIILGTWSGTHLFSLRRRSP